MKCECAELIEHSVRSLDREAGEAEIHDRDKLDIFREGMIQGSREIASRHLFRAGVYLASLERGMIRNPSPDLITRALSRRAADEGIVIMHFLSENMQSITEHAQEEVVQDLLSGILRRKKEAHGLLEAGVSNEIAAARNTIDLSLKMKGYLDAWTESVAMRGKVDVVMIADMHNGCRT